MCNIQTVCIVACQNMRVCISFKIVGAPDDACKVGFLFTAVLDHTALKASSTYFKLCSAATTVVSKGDHTLKLLKYALVYFQDTGERDLVDEVPVARQLVRSIPNVKKPLFVVLLHREGIGKNWDQKVRFSYPLTSNLLKTISKNILLL